MRSSQSEQIHCSAHELGSRIVEFLTPPQCRYFPSLPGTLTSETICCRLTSLCGFKRIDSDSAEKRLLCRYSSCKTDSISDRSDGVLSVNKCPSAWFVLGHVLLESENVFNCSRHQRLVTALLLDAVYKFSYLLTCTRPHLPLHWSTASSAMLCGRLAASQWSAAFSPSRKASCTHFCVQPEMWSSVGTLAITPTITVNGSISRCGSWPVGASHAGALCC